jgi:phosphohistidine phosphatase
MPREMARQVWLLRHGEAVPHDDDDDARPLTERGEAQARAAGRVLARLDVAVHLCLTSPKVRARRTAELACAELGIEPVGHEPLRSGFDAREALALANAPDADQRLLLVGHEPDFSQVVHDLTGGRVQLKKGGVAGIRLDGGHAELVLLARPRELAVIAAAPA